MKEKIIAENDINDSPFNSKTIKAKAKNNVNIFLRSSLEFLIINISGNINII